MSKSGSAVLLAASLAVAALAGCDNSTGKADKAILNGVTAAPVAYTPDIAAKNVATMEALSKQADASLSHQALAKAALAAAESESAHQVVADLQRQELLVASKLWQMDQRVAGIEQIKRQIDAAARRDPTQPLSEPFMGEKVVMDNLKSKADRARGGADNSPWIPDDKSPLASVNGVTQQIKSLNDQIAKIQGNLDELAKQRNQLLTDAGKAQQDSEQAKDKESEDLYIKATDLRKKAAGVAVQIDAANATLVPLKQDLAVAQEHQTIVAATVESFDTSANAATAGFAEIKKTIDQLNDKARAALTGDKDSLKGDAVELNQLMAAAEQLRGKAVEQLKASASHYADAVRLSDSAKNQLKHPVDSTPSPDSVLYKTMADALEASALRLNQAGSLTDLASVQTAQALLLSRKAKIFAAASSAAIPMAMEVPDELKDDKLDGALKEMQASGEETYKSADDVLQNVAGGTAAPRTQLAAKVADAALKVGWSQLATIEGDTANASKYLADAHALQKDVVDAANGVNLPAYLVTLTGYTAPPPTEAPAPTPQPEKPKTPAPPSSTQDGTIFGNTK